jgi:tetratricopeptide (TPR) repeat protein
MAGDHRDTAAALAQAKQLLGVDPVRAAGLAREALKARPGSIEARLVLGAALRRSGDPQGALEVLAPLAAGQPSAWGLHYEHGMALAALGRCEAAAAALDRATRINPQSSLAWHALGDQLALLGQAEAASAAQSRVVPGSLGDPALGPVAAALFDRRDPAAREVLRTRFGIDLNDIAAICLLADVVERLGHDEAAAALLHHASDYLPARYRCALLLYRLERSQEALNVIEPVAHARPETAAVRALRAAILMQFGREREARDDYAAALAITPGDARLWHAYGHALRAVGQQAEAIDAYRRAIDLDPGFGEPWWSLANLKTWRFEPGDVDRMQALLADGGLDAESTSHVHFALGKAREDAALYADSFDHYRKANAARRVIAPHDAEGHSDFVRRTIETFSTGFLAERPGVGLDAPDPIFVLGMPRSGSTLVEQILASHSQVEGASELPDITRIARSLNREGDPYPEALVTLHPSAFMALGANYMVGTGERRRLRRAHFVDKFPGNFLHIGLIHLMLPRARIIDIRRNPLACCLSLFKQNFARGQAYSYDLGDLGRYFADYDALMRHFETVLPGRVLHLSYEALVEEPEGEVRRLLDYCDLAFEPGCLRFFESDRAVRTPSSEQVRQPIFRDGLEQWRHFEPWLGPLIEALGPLASTAPVRP